jgi:hypothetical protein
MFREVLHRFVLETIWCLLHAFPVLKMLDRAMHTYHLVTRPSTNRAQNSLSLVIEWVVPLCPTWQDAVLLLVLTVWELSKILLRIHTLSISLSLSLYLSLSLFSPTRAHSFPLSLSLSLSLFLHTRAHKYADVYMYKAKVCAPFLSNKSWNYCVPRK